MGPLAQFLLSLTSLVRSGAIRKIPQAIKFAEQQFGKVTPLLKNEQNAIAVCRKSVLRQKQIMNFGFRCKKGARFIPKKGTSKNLAKIKRKTNATRKRRKTKNKSRI